MKSICHRYFKKNLSSQYRAGYRSFLRVNLRLLPWYRSQRFYPFSFIRMVMFLLCIFKVILQSSTYRVEKRDMLSPFGPIYNLTSSLNFHFGKGWGRRSKTYFNVTRRKVLIWQILYVSILISWPFDLITSYSLQG